MALDTYDDLVAAIVDELKDSDLEAKAPQFIRLAEAQFDRVLAPLGDEITQVATTTADVATTSLPQQFEALRSLYLDDGTVLEQLSPDDLFGKYLGYGTGLPVHFAIIGDDIHWGPTPDAAYDITCHFVRSLQPLSADNPTNTLFESNPDLYLYGALIYAEMFGWNDGRARQFDQIVDSIINQIKRADAVKRRSNRVGTVAGTYF